LKHRLFTSIELPPETVSRIVHLQHKLEALGLPIQWQPSDKLHLTLNFLGRIAEEKIPDIKNTLTDVTSSYPSFFLKPSFLETMFQRHGSSFIYLGPTGDLATLTAMHKHFSQAWAELNIPQPKRFLPHIVIGTVKKADPVFTKSVLDRINSLPFAPLAQFKVEEVTLFESFLARDTSHFQRLGRFALSP
jgi:RNA 2',3'-cyclic 3'-phosphodiesterase